MKKAQGTAEEAEKARRGIEKRKAQWHELQSELLVMDDDVMAVVCEGWGQRCMVDLHGLAASNVSRWYISILKMSHGC